MSNAFITSSQPLVPHNPSGAPIGPWHDVPLSKWDDWRWQQTHRLRRIEAIEKYIGLSPEEFAAFQACDDRFHVAITPYYASLIDPNNPLCPIRAQSLPRQEELLQFDFELEDPLGEEPALTAPGITHRYPDRVLFYVTHNCPVYCRHCTRKRKVSDPRSTHSLDEVAQGLEYIRRTPEVRDVLVSGGDPLTLSDDRLLEILEAIARIDHVDIIRLGTRNPVTLPQRITEELAYRLRSIRSLYINTHFNHPAECTERAALALERLASAGAVLGNQMVLLRGVNDDPLVVEQLNRWLLRHRCRPYYMFQADMAQGITHFRTPLRTGIDIVDHLRGRLSGPGIPHFAIDLPGGGGKITLTPNYLKARKGHVYWFRNGEGKTYRFVDAGAQDEASENNEFAPDLAAFPPPTDATHPLAFERAQPSDGSPEASAQPATPPPSKP